ncbi:hypothetical protein FRC12_000799 [Ceratobasidium sp. 428]|nr:hypothetical protein FRC12_000799 [Ceratobasidium sp. 428]
MPNLVSLVLRSAWIHNSESHFVALKTYGGKKIVSNGKIKVYWHVISAGKSLAQGNMPDAYINASITATNSHLTGTGLTLELAQVDRTMNANWFDYMYIGTSAEAAMKGRLRKGGAADLNIYTVGFKKGPGQGLLGYAAFPSSYGAHKTADGIVLRHDTVPGGAIKNYNEGKTLTHELGHWLGLYHTFQGDSCSGPGDFVHDTPAQKVMTDGCPKGKDTCQGGGPDPIHNFMDYSYDSCMNEFTPGQIKRIQQQIRLYRGIQVL